MKKLNTVLKDADRPRSLREIARGPRISRYHEEIEYGVERLCTRINSDPRVTTMKRLNTVLRHINKLDAPIEKLVTTMKELDTPIRCYDCNAVALSQTSNPRLYECVECGFTVHYAVAEEQDTLTSLADRDDKAGAYAERLLETGGVQQ